MTAGFRAIGSGTCKREAQYALQKQKGPDKIITKCQIVGMRMVLGMLLMDLSLSDILGGPLVCYDIANL